MVYEVRSGQKLEMTDRIISKVGWVLMFFAGLGTAFGQKPNSEGASLIPQRGKSVFESRCATCHGLDGLGGEHAPDIAHRAAVRTLSDQALTDLIHEGIPESGMPGFSDMDEKDSQALVSYLRLLQGESAGIALQGDPIRGKELFFGKAGCSACHQIDGRGKFTAHDLAGFARDHQVGEIREAIISPPGAQENATVVGRNGRKFSGVIRNEDNASLQLQDENGRLYLLMKSTVMSVQRKNGEAMPIDYGQRLTGAELDDLLVYILQQAGVSNVPSLSPGKDEEVHVQD